MASKEPSPDDGRPCLGHRGRVEALGKLEVVRDRLSTVVAVNRKLAPRVRRASKSRVSLASSYRYWRPLLSSAR